jgi:hypothetical protein
MKKVNGKYPDSEVLANALKQMEELIEYWMKVIPAKIPFLGVFKIRFESFIFMDLCLKSCVILHEKGLTELSSPLLEKIEKINARLSKDNYNDNLSTKREVNMISDVVKEIIEVLRISIEKYDK